MAHEMMVALMVTDGAMYDAYRAAMAPLLDEYGGGFRSDFDVGAVRKSATGSSRFISATASRRTRSLPTRATAR